MSFWSTLEADINKGLEIAAVVVGVTPQLQFIEPILTEVAQIVGAVENALGHPITAVSTQQQTALSSMVLGAAVKQVLLANTKKS